MTEGRQDRLVWAGPEGSTGSADVLYEWSQPNGSAPPAVTRSSLVNTSCSDPWAAAVALHNIEFIVPIVVLVVFNLVVVGGNLLVIAAVLTHSKLRTVTNTFILSLAAADLMLGVLVLPFSAANEVLRWWPFGAVWCGVWLAVDVWVCTSSILNLCAISLDRYLAISRPFKYPRLMSPLRAKLLVAFVWIVSFVICFPPLIGWNERKTGAGLVVAGDDTLVTANVTRIVAAWGDAYNGTYDWYALLNDTGRSSYGSPGCAPADMPVCMLTSEPGYIVYSAVGSFWIPVWIMGFFYWRIYRLAVRTTSALRRGVLTTKTSQLQTSPGSEHAVTLRVHRGGSATYNKQPPKAKHGHTSGLAPSVFPDSRRSSDSTCSPVLMRHHPAPSTCPRRHRLTPSRPKIKITFSRSEPNAFDSAGERQPLKSGEPQAAASCTQTPHCSKKLTLVQNDTGVETVDTPMNSEEEHKGLGFLNKVSKIHLKTHLRRLNKEKKAAKTVGIIVGCFVLCWAPFFTVYLMGAFCETCTPKIVFTIFFWLGYCNSAVNPCIYALCSKDFRYAFKKLIRCRCERRPRRSGSRFVSWVQSLRIQISSRENNSNSE